MNETEIRNAYQKLECCRKAFLEAAQDATVAKSELEKAVAAATNAGEITGKNEAERKASQRLLLDAYYNQVEAMEHFERQAKTDLESAQDEVEMIGRLLRNEELMWKQIIDLQAGADIIWHGMPKPMAQAPQPELKPWPELLKLDQEALDRAAAEAPKQD